MTRLGKPKAVTYTPIRLPNLVTERFSERLSELHSVSVDMSHRAVGTSPTTSAPLAPMCCNECAVAAPFGSTALTPLSTINGAHSGFIFFAGRL